MIKWNSMEIIAFLSIFENYESLWNVKHPDYSNKKKRDTEFEKLACELTAVGLARQGVEVREVRAKLKCLKDVVRQEATKVAKSRRNGDDTYEPKLVWFQNANFLMEAMFTKDPASSWVTNESDVDPNYHNYKDLSGHSPPTKKKRLSSKNEMKDYKEDPDLDLARLWAGKLKRLAPNQRIFAEKFINDILFEGQLGTLNRNSVRISDCHYNYVSAASTPHHHAMQARHCTEGTSNDSFVTNNLQVEIHDRNSSELESDMNQGSEPHDSIQPELDTLGPAPSMIHLSKYNPN